MRHLWYSEKAAKQLAREHFEDPKGHSKLNFYRREDGSEVLVTFVTQGPDHGAMWDDIEYRGEGVWSRCARDNEYPSSLLL